MKSTFKRPRWASIRNIAGVASFVVVWFTLTGATPPYPSETVLVLQEG